MWLGLQGIETTRMAQGMALWCSSGEIRQVIRLHLSHSGLNSNLRPVSDDFLYVPLSPIPTNVALI